MFIIKTVNPAFHGVREGINFHDGTGKATKNDIAGLEKLIRKGHFVFKTDKNGKAIGMETDEDGNLTGYMTIDELQKLDKPKIKDV